VHPRGDLIGAEACDEQLGDAALTLGQLAQREQQRHQLGAAGTQVRGRDGGANLKSAVTPDDIRHGRHLSSIGRVKSSPGDVELSRC